MKNITSELRKEFTMLENFEMKPNFSHLGKKYGLDPRTVKKYYEGYAGKPATRNKPSTLDAFDAVIEEKMSLDGIKLSSLYFYLKNEKDYKGSYSALTYYIRKNDKYSKKPGKAHVRYETGIGEQLQFDWVENITMISKYGEEFNFNVFSSELSYSRMHYFNYCIKCIKC